MEESKSDLERGTADAAALALGLAVGFLAAIWILVSVYTGWEDGSAITRIFAGALLGLTGGAFVWVGVFSVLSPPLSALESYWRRKEVAQKAKAERAADARRRQLGRYADIVESSSAAARALAESEAARTGWLGDDVNFDPDIKVIAEKFRKAHDLQTLANKLSTLDDPTPEDRKLLAEAKATIGQLESVAKKRAVLIARCAAEAELIDNSLQQERADAKTAYQRAELHAELSSMLHGIKATPEAAPLHSAAADGVMARVQAYREIKNQLQMVRDETTRS